MKSAWCPRSRRQRSLNAGVISSRRLYVLRKAGDFGLAPTGRKTSAMDRYSNGRKAPGSQSAGR